MWHFDGNEWIPVDLPITTFDVYGIYSFGVNDLWVAGETATDVSLILHYDGLSWKNFSNTNGKSLNCLWGSISSDMWAVGVNTLFHFNGSAWNKFPFFIPPQGLQLGSVAGLNQNDIYMIGYRNDVVQPLDTSFYYLYNFNGNQWSVVDSSYSTSGHYILKFRAILKTIGGELYSAGDRLFKKVGNDWIIINDDPLVFSLGGINSNNIFAAGLYGTVYHFNGSDWKKIIIKEGFQENIYDIWTDGTEAFMIASDGRQSYVVHGK